MLAADKTGLSPPLLLPDLASSFNCENKDPGCPFCSPRERRATGSMHLHPCAAPLRSSPPPSPLPSPFPAAALCVPSPRSFLACHLCSDGFVYFSPPFSTNLNFQFKFLLEEEVLCDKYYHCRSVLIFVRELDIYQKFRWRKRRQKI